MDPNKIKVKIVDITRVVFDGYVEAFTSKDVKGPFDILPDHANFISVIEEKIILVHQGGREEVIPIEMGVLRHLVGTVEVYLGINIADVQLLSQNYQQVSLKQPLRVSQEKLSEYQKHVNQSQL